MLRTHCRAAGHLVLLTLLAQAPAAAAVFTVTKTADTKDNVCDADCSLREAVMAANAAPGEDSISVGPGVYELTRSGVPEDLGRRGDLDVLDDLVIVGAGAGQTILDGVGLDRVLHVVAWEASLELRGVTVRGGAAPPSLPNDSARGYGGGIFAFGGLKLVDCVISGNSAEHGGGALTYSTLDARGTTFSENTGLYGGGLYAISNLRLENVTFAGNRARVGGGAYLAPTGFDYLIRQTTVAGNEATSNGGGFFLETPTCPSGIPCPPGPFLQLDLSIVAGNSAPQGADCENLEHFGTANVFGDPTSCFAGAGDAAGTAANPLDPKLALLGDYGGATPTRLPPGRQSGDRPRPGLLLLGHRSARAAPARRRRR